jgi:hypothetical protein
MTKEDIELYSGVSIFGTIGGAASIIFAMNAFFNLFQLKNRFKKELVKDIIKNHAKNGYEEKSGDKILAEIKWLFSFEGMYQIFQQVNNQHEKNQSNNQVLASQDQKIISQ